jgi:hypothetical protein
MTRVARSWPPSETPTSTGSLWRVLEAGKLKKHTVRGTVIGSSAMLSGDLQPWAR